jgi:membrane-bound serine protease (ClpP class)
MPAFRALLVGLMAALLAVVSVGAAAQDPQAGVGPVRVIELDGGIDPVSAAFVGRRLDAAADDGASVVVIRLDTPGGLVSSMRDIVTDMGASPVPVTVWIGPSGARAGSAGAYISAAADRLGMAPGTNIGSATPIGSGGQDLDRKVTNDSAAFIQALAEEHGRNGAAYRAMVVSALNLTAEQAVERNVAEVIEPTVTDFIAWLDGQPGRAGPIHTTGAPVETDALPWYLRGLQVLTDPTLVFFLLLLGLGGLAFEVFHPGAILPGVAGGICLVLGLAGLTVLPFSWAGIALLLLGVGLLVAETQVGGFGALAAGGVVALALGGAFLFDSDDPGQKPSLWAVVLVSVAVGGGFAAGAVLVLRARRRPVTTGAGELVGELGTVRAAVGPGGGHVLVNGERWRARAREGVEIPAGQSVRVVTVNTDDLTVTVEQTEE